ncbi:MAG: tRNA (adenosine(37)-N6)-threonylcarbamoyltransferase complex dimerization subunit type 1 TsaB [bacterium]|nr:tRNA (adenosine(37)-N6)-threonylcarbamoyltransferase complex dimerization subunit type 1 TsaB [bacterium]
MKILALDTSGPTQSVALLHGEELRQETQVPQNSSHTETLLPTIETLLQRASWSLKDLELLAVTVGPGSFTGLRIGLATVKGLSRAHSIPAVGVSTLEAMAFPHLGEGGSVLPCLDARQGEIYAAGFAQADPKGEHETLLEPQAQRVEDFLARIEKLPFPHHLLGSGIHAYPDLLQDPIRTSVSESLGPQAQWVGRLALKMYTRNPNLVDFPLSPRYLRSSTAEQKRAQKA